MLTEHQASTKRRTDSTGFQQVTRPFLFISARNQHSQLLGLDAPPLMHANAHNKPFEAE